MHVGRDSLCNKTRTTKSHFDSSGSFSVLCVRRPPHHQVFVINPGSITSGTKPSELSQKLHNSENTITPSYVSASSFKALKKPSMCVSNSRS
jgi:hypothetical protein